jgi:1,4-alpha-glucan branching enzyme
MKTQAITEAAKDFFSLSRREKKLEIAISSALLSVNFSNLTHEEFNNKIPSSQKQIEDHTCNILVEVVLRVVNFVIKIFNKNPNQLDRLLTLNRLAYELRKKHIEIINLHNVEKISLNFVKYGHSPYLSKSIKLGIYELQKFEYKLLQTELAKLRKGVSKKTTSQEELSGLFASMPLVIRSELIQSAKESGFTEKDFKDQLKTVLLTKKESKKSILNNLEHHYANQIKQCQKMIDQGKSSLFLGQTENLIVAGKAINPIKERYVFDASADHLTGSIHNRCLKNPISVVLSAVEYAGLIKEGGLAEAVEGLSKALKQQNPKNTVTLVFPKFSELPKNILENLGAPEIVKPPEGEEYKVYTYHSVEPPLKEGVICKFIEHPSFEITGESKSIYAEDAEGNPAFERFAIFSRLAADYIYQKLKKVDIIHLHDWHVAGIALKLKKDHQEEWDKGKIPPIVFTYHNAGVASQGRNDTGPYSYKALVQGYIENGITDVNDNLFIKTLEEADVITTVSEKYALETQDPKYGDGISFVVREASKVGKLVGIINGANLHRWNPETDASLKAWKDVHSGNTIDLSYGPDHPDIMGQKEECKRQLQKWIDKYNPLLGKTKKIQLDPQKPIVTYIGRFDSSQKGLDKFEEAIEATLKRGGQFICMGTGEDAEATLLLNELEEKYQNSDKVFFIRDFKDEKGRLFYQQGNQERPGIGPLVRASSDAVFIPSSYEPCGLVQMEGWLFGSLAIGSNTGGLADTIITQEKNKERFNGYLFCREGETAPNCTDTITVALDFWKTADKASKNTLAQRLMREGRLYTWDTSPTSKGYSPIEKYRFAYELAKKKSRFRSVENKGLGVDKDPGARLKIYPRTDISLQSQQEEEYLANYYKALETGVSIQELEELFFALPKKQRGKFPSPYSVGVNYEKHQQLGALYTPEETRFVTYAPHAKSVVLVLYDEKEQVTKEHQMQQDIAGNWECSLSQLKSGQRYHYKINNKIKIDPYSRKIVKSKHEKQAPYSVVEESTHKWKDGQWIKNRALKRDSSTAMSIYEVHPTAWKKKDGQYMNYRELAKDLAAHVKKLGFTHVELMGILEHPDEKSWGYQSIGWFAPNSRLGSVDDFKYMVDYLHKEGIHVILDWVPNHFAINSYALGQFDDTELFESSNTNLSYLTSIRKWFFSYGSKHFDYTKQEVRDFLISSAYFWLKEMHIDGLRVDCVRPIIHSESPKESQLFLKQLNTTVHEKCPGTMTIAEDFSGDTRVLQQMAFGGFGFDLKWNVPWNHFVLNFFGKPLKKRKAAYDQIVKALSQPLQQNQIPYFSHDELNSKSHHFLDDLKTASPEEKLATLKSMLSLLMTSKGAKLIFSGIEFMNETYWDHFLMQNKGIMEEHSQLKKPQQQVMALLSALVKLHKEEKALYFEGTEKEKEILGKKESEQVETVLEKNSKLHWIEDPSKTVHAYRKAAKGSSVAIFHNFTDTDVKEFTVTIPKKEGKNIQPIEIFSSDDAQFGGQDRKNAHIKTTVSGNQVTYTVSIPPSTTILVREH